MAEVWQATITDSAGNIIPRAVVDVRDETTGDLAPIFSDVDGLIPQRNPFFADDVGFARFYADAGLYQVRARRGAEERIYENVLLGDASATYYVWQHQVSDNEGNALSQALVELRDADTDALASLYADENGSTPLDNPFRADDDGVARCYVAAGVYKITVSRGVTFETTYEDVVVGPAPDDRDLYAWQSLVVDEAGVVQPGASVLVTDAETGDPATIYEDEDETPLENPFETGDDGLARFYVAFGTYDIRIRDCCIQQVLKDVKLGMEPSGPIEVFVTIGFNGGSTYGVRNFGDMSDWGGLTPTQIQGSFLGTLRFINVLRAPTPDQFQIFSDGVGAYTLLNIFTRLEVETTSGNFVNLNIASMVGASAPNAMWQSTTVNQIGNAWSAALGEIRRVRFVIEP